MAEQHKNSVTCEYCEQANPNPNFVSYVTNDDEVTEKVHQVIRLKQSSISLLYSGGTLISGVTLFNYYMIRNQNLWIYLLTAVMMIIPSVNLYFVPAHWEQKAKDATSQSHQKYRVEYTTNEVKDFHWFLTYVFLFWFTIKLCFTFVPLDRSDITQTGTYIFTFFITIGTTWFLSKLIEIIGEIAGRVLSRE